MPDKVKKASPAPKTKSTKGKSLAVKLGFKTASSKKVSSKDKSSKRQGRGKAGFSLYSSESDDPVVTMNEDIDKCSNILNQFIAAKQDKLKKSPDMNKKGSKKSDSKQSDKIIYIPTSNQNGESQVPLTKSVVYKETLMEVKTPFNNRLVSSTPDPDKILEEGDLPVRDGPEPSRTSAPVGMSQAFVSARDLMRPIAQAHMSQGQNYVHIHKISDSSIYHHNLVNRSNGMTQRPTDLTNRRPEYITPPCKPEAMLKNGKRCYSNDELTYGQRDTESPLDLSGQKASELNTSGKQRPLSTDSIMDLRKQNLINFDSEEERQSIAEERRGSNIEDLQCYVEKDDITSPPDALKAPKQTRKSLNKVYEQHEKKKTEEPDFEKKLKHFQQAAKTSLTSLTSEKPEKRTIQVIRPTSTAYINDVSYPPAKKHNKFLDIDGGATPMPSPVRMAEPRARAILGRPHHTLSPEADESKKSINSSKLLVSPPRVSPPKNSPPKYLEQTGQFSPQLSPTADWNRGHEYWIPSEADQASQPMVTPAKQQMGQHTMDEEDEPYINIVDYPKEEGGEFIEESSAPPHQICDLPPNFARFGHLSDTPANSPIRFPRPRSQSSSRLSALAAETPAPTKKTDHPFLKTILTENQDSSLKEQDLCDQVTPLQESDIYSQQSTGFMSKPLKAIPGHLFHVTPMNSPVRPLLSNRSEVPSAQESEYKGDNEGSIPTTNDPIGSIKKLRWLLTELLEVCDIDGDQDMCQLVQDLSNTVESIPQLKLTFNMQTEVELALQPLRTENSQLRRRLRIVNQQLKERERLEKEASSTSGVNFQVLHLQASNSSLQKQLKEEKEHRTRLVRQVEEFEREEKKSKENRQNLIIALGEKVNQFIQDNDRLKLRQENNQENQKLRQNLALAQTRTEGSSLKLEASDRENHILKISLKQRDSEIERLQEVVVTLKEGVNEVLGCLERNHTSNNGIQTSRPHNGDSHTPSFSLQRLLNIIQQDNYPTSPTKSIQSDLGSVSMVKPSTNQHLTTGRTSSPLTQHALAQHDQILRTTQKKDVKMTSQRSILDNKGKEQVSHKTDQNANVTDDHTINGGVNNKSRYSVTDYFKKYPVSNGTTNSESLNLSSDTPRLSPVTTSNQEDAYKGRELDISLSSIQDDVQSVMSSVSESSTSTAVDDSAFREGIATLDANIAKVQEALQRTKKIFS